jgi:hypothetical protein
MDAQPKRVLSLDAHVIAYLGDYMINLKKSLINVVHTVASAPNGRSSTSSSHRKS